MSETPAVDSPEAASVDTTAPKAKKKKKEKKQTYRLMRMLLNVDEIQAKKETFPSDQFIIRNLPDAIKKTEGAAGPAKIVIAAAAVTVTAALASIIAPIALFATSVIGAGVALVGGSIGMGVAVAGALATRNEGQEFIKDHGENLGKYLLSKHVIHKGQELRQSWAQNKEERKQKEAAEKAQKAKEKAQKAEAAAEKKKTEPGTASKLLSGALDLTKSWRENTTPETREKAKDGIKNAGTTAKEKLGSFYKRFKNRGKDGGNKPA